MRAEQIGKIEDELCTAGSNIWFLWYSFAARYLNSVLSSVYSVPEKPVKYANELFMPTEMTLILVCHSLLVFSIEEGKASTSREHELRDSGCPGVKPSHTLQW